MGRLAAKQRGGVARRQLLLIGIPRTTIDGWVRDGFLLPVLPGVYAVGHRAPSVEADLAAAVLYAWPGAMLSHATAAWWHGLLPEGPVRTDVSTPRRPVKRPGILLHTDRALPRIWHLGLPVTTIAQTLLDFAAVAPMRRLRFVLANADYAGKLDLEEVVAVLGRGRPGSAALWCALESHEPRLARTRSDLERSFLALCERFGIPLPETNVYVEGWLVDAVWREAKVVVELDGLRAHRTRAQLDRDHERDLAMRRAGFICMRYGGRQIEGMAESVAADVIRALVEAGFSLPARSAGSGSR